MLFLKMLFIDTKKRFNFKFDKMVTHPLYYGTDHFIKFKVILA